MLEPDDIEGNKRQFFRPQCAFLGKRRGEGGPGGYKCQDSG